MEVQFRTARLAELEKRVAGGGLPPEVIRSYRKRLLAIRAAVDERDLYALKSNHLEKLQGNRTHQHSLRLNDQWRLVVEIRKGNPRNVIFVIEIEDYH